MNKFFKLMLFTLILSVNSIALLAQGIKGTVKDAATGQGIPGASVVVEGRSSGTATDANGAYTLRLATGSYRIKISSVGYQTKSSEAINVAEIGRAHV